MKTLKINSLLILLFFISACSSIPSNTSNSCSIFGERYLWFKHAKKSEKYRTIKAVGPKMTHARTHESELIGSYQSLKTSGEPNSQFW